LIRVFDHLVVAYLLGVTLYVDGNTSENRTQKLQRNGFRCQINVVSKFTRIESSALPRLGKCLGSITGIVKKTKMMYERKETLHWGLNPIQKAVIKPAKRSD